MPPRKEPDNSSSSRRRRPADNPIDREQQMINYADELAEKQLRSGTAAAPVIIHYLKLGTEREKHEREKLVNENLKTTAQIEQIRANSNSGDLYERVLTALRVYTGQDEEDDL